MIVPVQYLHYAPYGELIENQQTTYYNERYKFTGKERDWESGYDYVEARFLWSDVGTWLSVDPLVDTMIDQKQINNIVESNSSL